MVLCLERLVDSVAAVHEQVSQSQHQSSESCTGDLRCVPAEKSLGEQVSVLRRELESSVKQQQVFTFLALTQPIIADDERFESDFHE